ncbi:TonB-dependent receptor domain-containing protein [Fibrisoma montanum]|nr:TonB-dependent receptor [Fibrisoma montanum]
MARLFTLVCLLLLSSSLSAQSIRGTVTESNAQPVPFAAVKLLAAADSSLVTGTVTDEAGRFSFSNVAAGRYFTQVSFVGRANATSPLFAVATDQPLTLSPIRLAAEAKTLNAVVVKARQQVVEQQVDKTVLNVQADATAAGKTAYELLQQAPGVVIDPNDNIQMAGKQGVNVYIDGKPANLSPTDLANLLKSTPASTIDKVELITNPSARFDAQGNAGIINIRFRRDKSLGLNGSVTGGYSQSTHSRRNAATDLNYRSKNLNLFGNVGWVGGYQRTQIAINRNIAASQVFRRFEQRGYDADGWDNVAYKIGADYFVDSRQTVGVVVTGNGADNRYVTYSLTQIKNAAGRIDSSLVNRNDNPNQNSRINAALNYRYADTLGLELTLDADYTRFTNDNPSRITNDYRNADQQLIRRTGNVFDAATTIAIQTLKGDLTKVWKTSRTKLEAGFKSTYVRTNNNLLAFLLQEGGLTTPDVTTPDVSRTNQFQYRENVNALYVSVNKELKKWTLQAGLRAEHSDVTGISRDLRDRTINRPDAARPNAARPDTTYLNLFPTAFVQYQATQHSLFQVNYGRRIGRPSYQDMNPFVYQIDPYTSQRGNPFLRPQYTHNVEFGYTYKWATTLKLGFSRSEDFFTDITHQEGIITYQTVENVGRADVISLSVSTPISLTKWWNSYVYAGATWNRYVATLDEGPLDASALGFNAYMQHTFTLPKTITIQVSGFYNAPTQQTIFYTRGLGSLNLSVQKKVLNQRGTLTLGAEDLLNTMRWAQSVNFGPQQFDLYRKWESRRAKVQFSYRFGSQKIKAARERTGSEDADRIKVKSAN